MTTRTISVEFHKDHVLIKQDRGAIVEEIGASYNFAAWLASHLMTGVRAHQLGQPVDAVTFTEEIDVKAASEDP